MRYAVPFDTESLPQESSELVVVGSGVAGLRAALSLAEEYAVTVVTKAEVRASNTWWAQGGIAAVLQESDRHESHVQDTLEAGAGLCDRPAVETLVREGPGQVRQLIDWGADFDRTGDGNLDFGREGGHSASRIVHGRGDATGSLVEDTLVEQVTVHPKVTVYENTFMIDLLARDGRVHGILVEEEGQPRVLWARGVLLATGGLGQVYRETTNHGIATGDGMAAALRAGLPLRDMEFIQFHPTTLYVAGGPRFLISEAVRGAGGVLRDESGERFMEGVHPRAELAPRDIVSRAILHRMIETDTACVYLDVSDLSSETIENHFPTINEVCGEYEIDLPEDPIPVRPCAHYCMGGIHSDLSGTTDLANLFALGEVACTGVHGANRLASNSLLEGLVMGSRVIKRVRESLPELRRQPFSNQLEEADTALDRVDLRRSLKSLLWRQAGILRESEGLRKAREQITNWEALVRKDPARTRDSVELKNMLLLGRAIVEAALKRTESRGAHFREDYPEQDPDQRRHSLLRLPGWSRETIPVEDEPSTLD